MRYRNARIYGPDFQFHMGSFEVNGDVFGNVCYEDTDTRQESCGPEIDLAGATVIPGLIDIHSHGNSGADFSDGDYDGLVKMAHFYLQHGITSFVPTSMTLPYDVLSAAFANAKRLRRETDLGIIKGSARMLGIHMEGPFFSYKKRGAQNPEYLKNPDIDGFRTLYEECGGLISIVDLAPELDGAEAFTREVEKLCTVSVAHTDAGYEDAKRIYEAGASHLTHLFNAMPGIHHRETGVIGAASEKKNVTAEIICDGYHVHPAAVRLAFSLFGAERMVLISDSGRCAGMPEGSSFSLGGQQAWLRDGVGRLGDGTIACSAANLWDCMCNVMRWGIPEEDAVRAATWNPAVAVRQSEMVGSIAPGRKADFVITNEKYERKEVYIGGEKVDFDFE